ncbi:WD40 repeat domain-containing protein [Sulfurimonas sp.]|uniref:WD40 repeat domain-containing protein n=1 Tax=Sulfurimonas sp. TaxID=2022749 RepID=UPI00260DD727|nr:WD40 repeat domain-containing protein [Sulfurimonas sp.]MCW8896270.1 WD40 repeat domain-containing protein [Sulfurimonas sp.]
MSYIQKHLTAKSDIEQLKVIDSSLVAYSTKEHGIEIFNCDNNRLISNITHKYLNIDAKVSAFSPDGKMFAFVNNQTIYVLDIQTRNTIQMTETDNEEISIIGFDASSKYIIAGTKDARVLQYRYDSSTLLARLCSFSYTESHENQVNSFAFYAHYAACGDNNGNICIIDLHLQTNICSIEHSKSSICALCFLDENTIVSANKAGEVYITPLHDVKNHKRVSTPLSSIKQIIIMQNPDYVMLVGDSNIISIVDIKKYKIVHSKYIELKTKISKVALIDDFYLIIALQNNEIINIELPNNAKLKSLIISNSIEEAYQLVAQEPMLNGSSAYIMLEERFENDYLRATKALINNNEAQASLVLEIYKNINSKKSQIKDLFDAFKSYPRFQEIIFDKKYALAYAMASKFPALKQTKEYEKIESLFKTAFTNAQKAILKGDMDKAKEFLHEYMTVISKKPIIKLVLTQNREFIDFLKAIQSKDFKKIYELIDTNELFAQLPNYTSLMNEIDTKLKDIEQEINMSHTTTTREELATFRGVPHIKDKIEYLYGQYRLMQELRNAYNKDDFKSCYTLLDLHNSLKLSELGILLEKHWTKLMLKCEEYALNGNIKNIKKTLGELIDLPTRYNRTGNLIRTSFHVRIKQLLKKKNFTGAEAIIYSYIDVFGLDSEVVKSMKKFEKSSTRKLAITQTQQDRPPRDSWIDSDIIKSHS